MFCAQCGQWVADGESACGRCGAPVHGVAFGPLPVAPAAGQSEAAEPPVPVVPAGFWRRFATMIVDGLVLFFPTAIVRVLLGDEWFGAGENWDTSNALVALAVNAGIWWLYCAGLESSGAQGTLGQQLLGIRVCDTRLRRITFLRATARFLAQLLSALTCGLGYLLNLWTKRRQTLHDLIAGCVLARGESLPAMRPAPRGSP